MQLIKNTLASLALCSVLSAEIFTVPYLDLQQFTQSNAQAQERFVQEFGAALEQIGCVAINNCEISQNLLDQAYA